MSFSYSLLKNLITNKLSIRHVIINCQWINHNQKKKTNGMALHPFQLTSYLHSRYNVIMSRVMNKHGTRSKRIHFYSICLDLFSIFSFFFFFVCVCVYLWSLWKTPVGVHRKIRHECGCSYFGPNDLLSFRFIVTGYYFI